MSSCPSDLNGDGSCEYGDFGYCCDGVMTLVGCDLGPDWGGQAYHYYAGYVVVGITYVYRF